MFSFRAGFRALACVAGAGWLSSCAVATGTPSMAAAPVPQAVLVVARPIVISTVARPDGTAASPDPVLVAAEAAQLHNTLQAWLLRRAPSTQLRVPPNQAPLATPADDAATARLLAAQQQSDLVLITHLYHHRMYFTVPGAPQTSLTVAAQTTAPGTVINVPAPTSPGPFFREELSADMTLYAAGGTVRWKYTRRGTPDASYPTAGHVADNMVRTGLMNMPLPGR